VTGVTAAAKPTSLHDHHGAIRREESIDKSVPIEKGTKKSNRQKNILNRGRRGKTEFQTRKNGVSHLQTLQKEVEAGHVKKGDKIKLFAARISVSERRAMGE